MQALKINLLSTYNVTGTILDINTWFHIYVLGSHITQTSGFVLFTHKNIFLHFIHFDMNVLRMAHLLNLG